MGITFTPTNYSIGDTDAPALYTVQTTDKPSEIESPVLFEVRGWSTAQLISFGNYLLSQKREERLQQTNIEVPESLPYEESKRWVHDADLQNWKFENLDWDTIPLLEA